ncbi:hypothetical protein BH23GEM9_BH23GEM9_09940 [soil metagenome]
MRDLQILKFSNASALVVALAGVVTAGCFEDRARPWPVEPRSPARLSVQVLAPRAGVTVATGDDIGVSVNARDLDGRSLTGIGFVARRLAPGSPVLDSAAVQFAGRGDSTHVFVLRVPQDLPTSTQVDIYGIAFGPGTQSLVSSSAPVVVVNCTNGVCR